MRDKITGEWRILYNGQIYTLYCLPNIIMNVKSYD